MIQVEDDEEDFLCEVAAAEAQAVSAKRRKLTTIIKPESVGPKLTVEEGAYTAALKGSKSLLWQQNALKASGGTVNVVSAPAGAGAGVGGGGCFKCGQSGHWARDCGAVAVGTGRSETSVEVADKNCPCGFGVCLILTANTEKNRGRKFFKCPAREENGGCGFFEWCDGDSGTKSINGGTQSYAVNSMFPDLPCPCGAGSCLTLTAKTGKNIGQQFYRCPANQGSSCGFFKWCNDHTIASDLPNNSNKISNNLYDNNGYGVRTSSSCFKCGKSGHWAKDCSTQYDSLADMGGGKSSSSGTCYKCGKPGHWARDCTSSQSMNVRQKY